MDDKLPNPVGYTLLCRVPKFKDTDATAQRAAAAGIVMPESATKREETATVAVQVVKIGPEAYKDPKKFPAGPWCTVGDFVIIRAYSGTRFVYDGNEYRLLDDDSIQAVAPSLEGFARI